MIRQTIRLNSWHWRIHAFYFATEEDAEEILRCLYAVGCDGDTLRSAEENLHGTMLNTGLTYTNGTARESVMVISVTTTSEEFWNTFDHEKGHLAQQIGEMLGLDPKKEPQQYLAGAIASRVYPVVQLFLCGKCPRCP